MKKFLRWSHFLTLVNLFFSFLEKDFEELMQRYFYDYIELQLDFAMDLYPFFPPLVKVNFIFSKNEKKICYKKQLLFLGDQTPSSRLHDVARHNNGNIETVSLESRQKHENGFD